jgi:hypothetical protein
MLAFRTFWAGCKDYFEELFLNVFMNVLWCLIALPLPILLYGNFTAKYYVGAFILAVLAPLPLAIANGGLAHLARRIADGRAVSMRNVWDSLWINLRKRIILHYVWAIVFYTCIFNMWFYSNTATMPLALTILFFDLSILWLGYLAYLLPLSEIQPEASLSVTMRNAAGLMFTIAGSSLIMIVIASLLFVASSLVIILHLLLFATLMTFWGTRLTDAAIATVKERQEHATQTTENNDNRAPSGQIRPKE